MFVFVLVEKHGSPTLPCKPICTEYSSAGSRHLYLIVCWVIYREPGIESDVYRHCSSSMGIRYAPPPPPPLHKHISCREQLSQNILTPKHHGYLVMQGQGGSHIREGDRWVNMVQGLAAEKEQLRSGVMYSSVSSQLSLVFVISVVSL